MSKAYISKQKKQLVFSRAKNRCEYCQCRSDVASASFEVEHILPETLSGDSTIANLGLSCRGCNSHKSTKTTAIDPESGKMVSLFNPRTNLWKQHFVWIDNFQQIKGSTSIGRATIAALQLNRTGVVNLRKLMILGKIHPPLDTV